MSLIVDAAELNRQDNHLSAPCCVNPHNPKTHYSRINLFTLKPTTNVATTDMTG